MIIQLDSYRKASSDYDSDSYGSRRLFGNTVPKMSLRDIEREAHRSAGPRLPVQFDDVNARNLIIDAYQLATQI